MCCYSAELGSSHSTSVYSYATEMDMVALRLMHVFWVLVSTHGVSESRIGPQQLLTVTSGEYCILLRCLGFHKRPALRRSWDYPLFPLGYHTYRYPYCTIVPYIP